MEGTLVRTGAARPPLDPDHLDLDAFRGRRVAVLGLARSGVALTRFLVDRGARVTVYDGRPADALSAAIAELGGREVELRLGPDADPAVALDGQELVCTSPAINSRYPTTEPRLRSALAAVEARGDVPVLSEVDLFLRLCPAATVGVTGTKGKTTTSALCASVLGAGEARVLLGGNIGTPLVERLPELTARDIVVLELSELQLPTLSRGTTVAAYTHVTQDHLDRHGSVAAYRAAKRRLAELVDPRGVLVLNADDPVSGAYAGVGGTARTVPYTRAAPPAGGVGVLDGWIVERDVAPRDAAPGASVGGADGPRAHVPGRSGDQDPGRIVPISEIRLPGEHNVSNVLAAVAVGLVFGIRGSAIRAAVAAFEGVEHRLETVARMQGVRYVNDSQGTQPDAVIAALRSFAAPVVLIAGGQDKGLPFDELARVAVDRAHAVVLIGENAAKLETALVAAAHTRVEHAPTLEAAVDRADAIARRERDRRGGAEATVLLSPAAASFDMFEDYAARGAAFRTAVEAIRRRESSDAGRGGGA